MELSRNLIEQLVREVIAEAQAGNMGREVRRVDPSGVITADPGTYVLEKFPFPIESDRVWLKDIYTIEESPRMGCGIMEMEDASFEWTLQYDEIDYIIDGVLDLIIDGRKVSSETGNVLLIPKGTKVTFSARGRVRFLYVVYPANWSEQ